MSHGRPPRKPRWQATPDTMVIARHRAAKPAPHDMATVTNVLFDALDALLKSTVTELQFSILRGAIDTARAIERQGVVKGLRRVMDDASEALDAIWPRITADGSWGHSALHHQEIAAVSEFVRLHAWQCRQLSRAEYLRAVESARGTIGPAGLVLYGSQAAHQAGA